MKLTKENIAIIERDTHISKWVEESGRLDHDQNALPKILPYINQGDVIFDIGAYIGDHTIAYARKGQVHAFEPNPEAFECLKYNMDGLDVHCRNIALSNRIHGYTVESSCDNVGMANITIGGNRITSTIDEYCFDYGIVPKFIKIDSEGFELAILQGGQQTITKHKPKLLLEVNEGAFLQKNTSKEELFDFLNKNGYLYHDIYGEPIDSLSLQFDIICIWQK